MKKLYDDITTEQKRIKREKVANQFWCEINVLLLIGQKALCGS